MRKGTAPVNGLEMHYEVHGEGRPLVMLHGGVVATESLGPNVAELAKSRRVIVAHMQAHGHTRDIDRPITYEGMADDVAALIGYLELGKTDLLGYSMGGGVALQIAIRHPLLVNRLVVVGIPMRDTGSYPEIVAAFAAMPENAAAIAQNIKRSPLAQTYPDADWETAFRKVGQMVAAGYDWSADVGKITAQTLLVYADADAIKPEHMVEFWKALGGGQRDAGLDGSLRPANRLAIVPGTTHYDIMSTTAVARIAQRFLVY
jgi:pimeloyl-ACP methyl ester carboxylesterase